jgi:cytochrome c oxidase subunit 2
MLDSLFYVPEAASAHAADIDFLNDLVHWLMLVLFVGWGSFFAYTLVRFRRSRNPQASYGGVKSHASSYLEIGVAVVEGILLLGFSIPLWADRLDEPPSTENAVRARVVGEQFAWNVHYPGADGEYGRTDVKLIDLQANPLGLDREDPAAKDDVVTLNQLHLPVDRPAMIELSSKDVIHSFNLPHMRVKQDTVPGLRIPVWFVPTVTTDEMRQRLGDPEFTYEIACAQLCGLGHYRMRGFLTVHTQEGFDAWMAEQAAAAAETAEGGEFWN